MPPPKVSQPCPPHPGEAWAKHRDLITNLYVDEDLTLKQVRLILEEDHGFPATERQYKRKIKEWKLDKNIKDDEMRLIIQLETMRRELEGKESNFRIRGRLVDRRKMHRFSQRKGGLKICVSTDVRNLFLPDDITCQTPVDELALSSMDEEARNDVPTSQDEDNNDPSSGFDMEASGHAQTPNLEGNHILIDHAMLNNFWQPYWHDHDPSKDIPDLQFLSLPIQVPAIPILTQAKNDRQRLPNRFQETSPRNINDSRSNKRRRVDQGSSMSTSLSNDHITPSTDTLSAGEFGEEATQSKRTTGTEDEGVMRNLMNNIQHIQQQQTAILTTMNGLRNQHDQLRSLTAKFGSSHSHHERSIDAIIQFLSLHYTKSLQGSNVDAEARIGAAAEESRSWALDIK